MVRCGGGGEGKERERKVTPRMCGVEMDTIVVVMM